MTRPQNPPANPAMDPALESLRCPCGGGDVYGSCCGRWHGRFTADGTLAAPTAEALMRSRYSAFALASSGDLPQAEAYLLATWAPETRPAELALDAPGQGPDADLGWVRLEVESTVGGGPFDDDGAVTFTAHFRTPAGRHAQHETSRFVRRQGTWLYRDGDVS
ncbi:YchJ family metal-binding protein [Citricoccus sp. NPDC055426]|uniref:YchJ family protein n=1 Tax=Citricoccus sp. NPDC055426 TaxID=3155536 RepID=UPI00342138CA